ncbi:MAG TPA: FAD-linked oxidase C-terminal domain-containing protein, partial [Gemmataceae bacterium]|nr:FAD-linked oxidase C-terminal domain-containing protein [Gemmataceae bacterium]
MTRVALPLATRDSARGEIDGNVLVAALREGVQGEVRFDRLSRALYSTDASVYQIVPLGVVLPKTEADIVHVVRTCARFGVPLTARGGGTSQAGQCIGPGVILDCSKHFHDVLEINAAERWARVRPGCVLDDLNAAAKPHGLHFAPDISTSNRATIGGMVANNSSGTHSVIHGKTIDHVLGLKAVLSDGSVIEMRPLTEVELGTKCAQQDLEGACYRVVRRLAEEHAEEIERRFPKILRRVGGYNLDRFSRDPEGSAGALPSGSRLNGFNLAHLLVGSEGTLAVTLEAKLRLSELPRAKAVLVAQFADLLDALAATPPILRHGPSAVEVIDRYVLDSTKLNPEASRLRDFLRGDPGAILIIELYADRPEDLPPRLDALEADLRQRSFGKHYHRAADAAGQARIWKLRKLALGLSMAEKGDAKALSFVEDTAVAPEHLRDYIAEFLDVVRRHGTTAGVYAHASVGCLHVRPVVNLKTEAGVRQFEAIAAEVAELVLKYGGALSGEHGDGLVRSPFQERMFGPVLYSAFREIKRTFDPAGILNPGKIVDAPPLSANLRYGPAYVTPEVPTTFDFSADGGIVRAVELCAGVGECRKTRDGTMCPSYQATRDEKDSTRGRANTLRLALTGQLGLSGLTDPAVKEALDLCLECKACKSECPTNVDMARLKAEFLHQHHQKHGLPWRNWVFGNVARMSRWGSRVASLSNWLMRRRAVRWLNEKALGIDRRRLLPALETRGFGFLIDCYMRLPEEPAAAGRQGAGDVLFFPDTFVQFYDAVPGFKAVDLCHRLGWRVFLGVPGDGVADPDDPVITGLRCCGRPFISNGMLTQAVRDANRNVERLHPWAAAGKPIIACEPSCILTLKDDYPALLRGEMRRKAEVVAAMCQTFEEFAESALASRGCQPPEDGLLRGLTPPARRILVQGHCHQRSLVGMGPTLRLLRRIPGAEVIDLDAGCCGMAGSFGYEKEHYEVSRRVGEQRLFPAVRQAGEDTIIVAPGFSCRLQIQHFTGRTALHPAEL